MSESESWKPVNTDGDVYYDLWKKFWGKPLEFEPDVRVPCVDEESEDDEESMAAEKSFKVLTIGAGLRQLRLTKGRLIVRQEYLDAVVSLNKQDNEWSKTGAVVIGHPGIGERLHDKLYLLLVSAAV
jgi:hypothetical protein